MICENLLEKRIIVYCFVLIIPLVQMQPASDNLPIVMNFAKVCKALADRTNTATACTGGDVLAWEIHNGFTLSSYHAMAGIYSTPECRRACYNRPNCVVIAYETTRHCIVYSKTHFVPKFGSELAVLSCCKIATPPYQAQVIVNAPYGGKQIDTCKSVQNRQEPCSNPKWMKHKDYSSMRDEIRAYRGLTEQDCMKKCNENIYCIVFSFREFSSCTLRHNLTNMDKAHGVSTYIQICCQQITTTDLPVVTFADKKCTRVSDRKTTCTLPKVLSWQINYDQTMEGSFTENTIQDDVLCRRACDLNANCIAVSKAKGEDKCKFFTTIKVKNQTDIELASRACCEKIIPLYKPTKIMDTINLNECPFVATRQSPCDDPVWIRSNSSTFDGGDIVTHEGHGFDSCRNLCKEDAACLSFIITVEGSKTKCVLKHKSNAYKTKVESTAYQIACCTKTKSDDLPVIVDSENKCLAVTNKVTQCDNGRVLAWHVRPGKRIGGAAAYKINPRINTEVGCRRACRDDTKCVGVTNHFNSHCYMHQEASAFVDDANADLAVLTCCTIAPLTAIHGKEVAPSEVHKDCDKVKNKYLTCHESVWEVHYNTDTSGSEIRYLSDVTLSYCEHACGVTSGCVAFTYNDERGCLLKYKAETFIWTENYATYILRCCASETKTVWVNDQVCTEFCKFNLIGSEQYFKITSDSMPQPHTIKFDGCSHFLFNIHDRVNLGVKKKDVNTAAVHCNVSVLVEQKVNTKEIIIKFESV